MPKPKFINSLPPIDSYDRDTAKQGFAEKVKPDLMQQLAALHLDKSYHRGLGDYLFYYDNHHQEQAVLDLVGGYGSSLLGHNHPALIDRAKQILNSGMSNNTQASSRFFAGLLAEKLNSIINQATEKNYQCTFANSGAEAVEAAIKHAELEAVQRIENIFQKFKETSHNIYQKLQNNSIQLDDKLLSNAAKTFGILGLNAFDDLVAEIYSYNRSHLFQAPLFWAVEGAFHGKKTGSLQLTYQREYREPWKRIGIDTVFIHRNSLNDIDKQLNDSWITYYDLHITKNNTVTLVEKKFCRVTACFIEPIQGEGGIIEFSTAFWQALRLAANQGEFPLVIDEIQTGMGRTGRFLASRHANCGDYYIFSKTLGGGLTKISALLVDRERYIVQFGSLHTSTFADDDYSCGIGLGVVELLTQNNHALIRECHLKGLHLKKRLQTLSDKYPNLIKDIRGKGLMIGLELIPPCNTSSPLLNVICEQKKYSFLLCSYLLNHHNIRLAPTLSAPNTLRIQPSVFINDADIDKLITAFEETLQQIQHANIRSLISPLIACEHTAANTVKASPTINTHNKNINQKADTQVAFIGHFLEAKDLLAWDNNLAPLSDQQCEQLLDKAQHIIDPFIVQQEIIQSPSHRSVKVITYGVPASAKQYSDAIKSLKNHHLTELLNNCVTDAKNKGCTVVGFGGYNSIISNNCMALKDQSIAFTSGNSLTSAAAIEALKQSLIEQQIPIEESHIAIVGAMGNIGKVAAEILAEQAGKIILLGRKGSAKRLGKAALNMIKTAYLCHLNSQKNRLSDSLKQLGLFDYLNAEEQNLDKISQTIFERHFDLAAQQQCIIISDDFEKIKQCDAIVTASNAAKPIITSEHINKKIKVICDVALPQDVDETIINDYPELTLIKGGLVKLPLKQQLKIPSMNHTDGYIFACLGETLLLGLSAYHEHFSYGALETQKVKIIKQLADLHGYGFDLKKANIQTGLDL